MENSKANCMSVGYRVSLDTPWCSAGSRWNGITYWIISISLGNKRTPILMGILGFIMVKTETQQHIM